MDSDSDLITQLTMTLAEAEANGDRPTGAAWTRNALAHAQQTVTQLDAIEALLLALIPARERGALTAQLIAERMPRLTATVGAAVERSAPAEQLTAEDQQRREQRRAAVGADQHG